MSIEPTQPESAVKPAPTVAVDTLAKVLAEYRECQDMVKFWQARQKKLAAQITDVLGDNYVGTIDGEKAVTYAPEKRFNEGEFKKHYPDMHKLYSRQVTEEKFDADWLARAQPEIYEQFQVRPLKIYYTAPGA